MKTSLRKITVGQNEFLYSVTDKYHGENNLNTLTVRVFLKDQKRYLLEVRFLTLDDFRIGQPLNKNKSLFHQPTNSMKSVNLHEPGYIRQLIDWAMAKGWTGSNRMEVQDGMSWLEESGFDVSEMEAEVEKALQKQSMTETDLKADTKVSNP